MSIIKPCTHLHPAPSPYTQLHPPRADRMLLMLIPTLVFEISNPKSIFGKIWDKKVKAICFTWKLAHAHYLEDADSCFDISFLNFQTQISSMLILILRLVFWNSKPKSSFCANFSQKCSILHFAWKLVHRVFWRCDCKDTEVGLGAKMNNCIRCSLFLYFYRS